VIVDDELFGMDLFRYLIKMKDLLMELHFVYRDQRVSEIVERYKHMI